MREHSLQTTCGALAVTQTVWEYAFFFTPQEQDELKLAGHLNVLGQQGWEVIHVERSERPAVFSVLCKRPKLWEGARAD